MKCLGIDKKMREPTAIYNFVNGEIIYRIVDACKAKTMYQMGWKESPDKAKESPVKPTIEPTTDIYIEAPQKEKPKVKPIRRRKKK